VDEILPQRFTRPEFEFLGQPPDFGPPKQPDGQRAPALPLHTGQAPQP
jgi:hypothetical protein